MTGILTYGATFALGLLHAFEPGHGKSILAAFSLKNTNLKVFASLIMSLYTSHFLVLGTFAFALQSLSSTKLLQEYSEHLQLIASLLVVAFGGFLFAQAHKHRKTPSGCSCGKHHEVRNASNAKTASITGFIAGLMPCPTAITPLILSGVHDGFSYTIIHILVYVTGMTLALFFFTGVLLLLKSYFLEKLKRLEEKVSFNYLSALIMISVGVVYFVMGILSPDTHQHF